MKETEKETEIETSGTSVPVYKYLILMWQLICAKLVHTITELKCLKIAKWVILILKQSLLKYKCLGTWKMIYYVLLKGRINLFNCNQELY